MVLSSKELSGNVVPLLKEAAFLAGDWVSDTEATIAVSNPADASNVGCVPRLTPAHVNHAIKAAVKSWPAWKAKRADERAEILHCWDALIRDNRESLATLMTLEQGKPIAESRAEIDYARSYIGWFAEEAKRQYGDVIPSHLPGAGYLSYASRSALLLQSHHGISRAQWSLEKRLPQWLPDAR